MTKQWYVVRLLLKSVEDEETVLLPDEVFYVSLCASYRLKSYEIVRNDPDIINNAISIFNQSNFLSRAETVVYPGSGLGIDTEWHPDNYYIQAYEYASTPEEACVLCIKGISKQSTKGVYVIDDFKQFFITQLTEPITENIVLDPHSRYIYLEYLQKKQENNTKEVIVMNTREKEISTNENIYLIHWGTGGNPPKSRLVTKIEAIYTEKEMGQIYINTAGNPNYDIFFGYFKADCPSQALNLAQVAFEEWLDTVGDAVFNTFSKEIREIREAEKKDDIWQVDYCFGGASPTKTLVTINLRPDLRTTAECANQFAPTFGTFYVKAPNREKAEELAKVKLRNYADSTKNYLDKLYNPTILED